MNVRAQTSMVFHLDKCIGCHTCSIACKNIWTDRRGTEYMWWNNVETKPGTGFPTLWEDQSKYGGGWERDAEGRLRLKSTGKIRGFTNIFHQPRMPVMDDYYEPWTYRYADLFNAPAGKDQPTARPISMVTGKHMTPKAGPNWDDDLGGSPVYAEGDPNLDSLPAELREQLFSVERMAFFYLPRICNHCLNPACVAACPSGAIYKRGEDGVVLINQDVCRGWRHCVPACPYKKSYYNWETGKSEKCLLCYPRLEAGKAPACFHTCVGRIRYLGVLLYDADRIEEAAGAPEAEIVNRQREMILNPLDPVVARGAEAAGISPQVLEAARRSPVYRFVKEWGMALPLHPEFRTTPMLFYVPPLLPALASRMNGGLFDADADSNRVPLKYLARVFAGGNVEHVAHAYRRLWAVRLHQRAESVGDIASDVHDKALKDAGLTASDCAEIYRLTALATFDERFAVPPSGREKSCEEGCCSADGAEKKKQSCGFGFRTAPERGM